MTAAITLYAIGYVVCWLALVANAARRTGGDIAETGFAGSAGLLAAILWPVILVAALACLLLKDRR